MLGGVCFAGSDVETRLLAPGEVRGGRWLPALAGDRRENLGQRDESGDQAVFGFGLARRRTATSLRR